jgi:hypothetical protein
MTCRIDDRLPLWTKPGVRSRSERCAALRLLEIGGESVWQDEVPCGWQRSIFRPTLFQELTSGGSTGAAPGDSPIQSDFQSSRSTATGPPRPRRTRRSARWNASADCWAGTQALHGGVCGSNPVHSCAWFRDLEISAQGPLLAWGLLSHLDEFDILAQHGVDEG